MAKQEDLLHRGSREKTEKEIVKQKDALLGSQEDAGQGPASQVAPPTEAGVTPPTAPEPAKPKADPLDKDAAEVTETAIVRHKIEPFKPIVNKAGLKGLWGAMEGEIKDIISKMITPQRVLKSALAATIRNKKLFQCTQQSWMMALIQSAQLGLDCSGLLGASYLVPFNNKNRLEIVYIIGYRGLIDLARRGGQIASISAHPVFEQDQFDPMFGTDDRIIHVPYLKADRKEDYVCFYAVGKLKDGGHQAEIMTLADVKKIQAMSKSNRSPDSPWKHHFAEMGRKTVVKRLSKYLPLSSEMALGLTYDNAADPIEVEVIDSSEIAGETGSDALAEKLGQ